MAYAAVVTLILLVILKATIGIRVSEEEELAGLDISTHGMYGYPESFIPQEEYPVGKFQPSVAGTPVAAPTATAMSASQS